ncbi:MAG: AraC family transcriptional regulator [Myxococcota bacterium]
MREPGVDWAFLLGGVLAPRVSRQARLHRVRRRLDLDFEYPWSGPELAREAGVSREQFIRSFRSAFGVTPHRYLVARRLDAARVLIERGETNVTEACYEVGFSSLGAFSTAFRRHHGLPPSAARRRALVNVPNGLWRQPRIPTCFLRRVAGLG